MGADLLDRPDPRLIALGLAPEPQIELDPVPIPRAEPMPRRPAVVPRPPIARPSASAAHPAPAAPPPKLRPSDEIMRADVLVGRVPRPAVLTLEKLGLRIAQTPEETAIPWTEVSAIDARRGVVRVRAEGTRLDLALALEGVDAPELGAPFAEVMRAISHGTYLPEGTAAVQLRNATDALRDRFHQNDDPFVSNATAVAAAVAVVVLLAGLPDALFVAMRPPVARDAFLLGGKLSSFDPRVIVVAVSGGALTSWLALRVALGEHAGAWVRGTLRGWHEDERPLVRSGRRILAMAAYARKIAAAALVLALIAALPGARTNTTVDPRGVHAFAPLPFLDRDASWAEVTDVAKVPAARASHPDGFTVLIRAGGLTVDTAATRLLNGGDAYFYDMVTRWRGQ